MTAAAPKPGAPAAALDGGLAALSRDVDLLCLDAGNTIIFFDHARLARLCARQGFATTAAALERAEGEAKVAQESGGLLDVPWSRVGEPGARGWGQMIATMLVRAGLPAGRAAAALDAIWPEHRAFNLWSRVPEGLVESLARLRAAGARVAVVSNSEGALEAFLSGLGVMPGVDFVVDSGLAGVEKPDPAIFRVALDRARVPPARAVHLGDNFATDVRGARAAGLRAALVDPLGHLAGRHPDVPRVSGVAELAGAIALARGAR